jgi:hypothetical protein
MEKMMNPALSLTNSLGRRTLMKTGLAAGGTALLSACGASPLSSGTDAADAPEDKSAAANRPDKMKITAGDAAILGFLAAAELLETDLWQQYNEFANLEGPYKDALEVLDDEMPEYVTQNTNDEVSHHTFLNALLVATGNEPVNLDAFRTLPSSPVAPVQAGRLPT